jgi:hypothetical protein
MPELAKADVEQYTGGRLDKDDAETQKILDRGLAAARRFCGWRVHPPMAETVTLDGSGGRLLRLPTLKLAEPLALTVVEDSVVVDVADLYVSFSGMLSKKSGSCWSDKLGGIVVTMTHGFDAAPDFDAAVLSWIDRASLAPAGGRARVIGPFQYESEGLAADSTFTQSERALLEQYRLERPA